MSSTTNNDESFSMEDESLYSLSSTRKVAILIDNKWYQCRDYQEKTILEFIKSLDIHKSNYYNIIKDGFNVPKQISKTFEPISGVVFTVKYDIEELFKKDQSFKKYQFIFSKEDDIEYITTVYHTWDTPESLNNHEVISKYGEISDELAEYLKKE